MIRKEIIARVMEAPFSKGGIERITQEVVESVEEIPELEDFIEGTKTLVAVGGGPSIKEFGVFKLIGAENMVVIDPGMKPMGYVLSDEHVKHIPKKMQKVTVDELGSQKEDNLVMAAYFLQTVEPEEVNDAISQMLKFGKKILFIDEIKRPWPLVKVDRLYNLRYNLGLWPWHPRKSWEKVFKENKLAIVARKEFGRNNLILLLEKKD